MHEQLCHPCPPQTLALPSSVPDYYVSLLPFTRHPSQPIYLLYNLTTTTGSTALVSLGAYTYISGTRHLQQHRKAIDLSRSKYKYGSRRLGLVGLSATLVGMGIYRTFN